MSNMKSRIGRLETAMQKAAHKCITAPYAYQHGLDGEIIRECTSEQVIERHLALHPEDKGKPFLVIERLLVTPTHMQPCTPRITLGGIAYE